MLVRWFLRIFLMVIAAVVATITISFIDCALFIKLILVMLVSIVCAAYIMYLFPMLLKDFFKS